MFSIQLKGLRLATHVGAFDEELARVQVVEINLKLYVNKQPQDLLDQLHNSVNYAEVLQQLQDCAMQRPRRLIETLAYDLAQGVLEKFAVQRVDIQLDKFILPQLQSVAIELSVESNCAQV